MAQEPMTVTHDSEEERFQIDLEGATALLEYSRTSGGVVITHTEVPPEFEGRGIAGKLVQAALEWARAEGLEVAPQCSYVAAYMRRHPDTLDLLHPEWRERLARK